MPLRKQPELFDFLRKLGRREWCGHGLRGRTWDDKDADATENKGMKPFKVIEKPENISNECLLLYCPKQHQMSRAWQIWCSQLNGHCLPKSVIEGSLPEVTWQAIGKATGSNARCSGPITYILKEAVKDQLTQKSAIEVAQTALHFLGNASMYASREKRKNALQSMNFHVFDDGIYKAANCVEGGSSLGPRLPDTTCTSERQ